MTSIQERKKCNKCKVNLLFKEFKPKRNGTLTKRCIKCLVYNKQWEQKNKCKHNKRKSYCKECGGSQICEHNKIKYRCKECGGSQICIHNKNKGKISFEYITFDKFNDSLDDANNLYKLCKNLPVTVNIIEYNPVEGVELKKSSENRIDQFAKFLTDKGVMATVRRSRGKDIDAACGQLANKKQ